MRLSAWAAVDVAAADAVRLAQGADLMATASAGLAHACTDLLRRRRGRVFGARAVLLVGAGNNGGDALLAGALLRRRGVAVTALLCAPRHHETGGRALRRAGGRLVQLHDADDRDADRLPAQVDQMPALVVRLLAEADLVVDGLLGIGSRGAPRGAAGQVLEQLASGPRPPSVVACDLPSGLDPDSGAVAGPVLAADVTVTFGVATPGLLLPAAQHLIGRLVVIDLGLEAHLPQVPALQRLVVSDPARPSDLVAQQWPWAWRAADKYARGVLGVVAGDAGYPGAAVLVTQAAAGAGAGMLQFVAPEPAADVARLVLSAVPEVVVQSLAVVGRVQAWVVGPGTSGAEDPRVEHVLTGADEPAVVDAGALTGLVHAHAAGRLRRPEGLLLTPHAGELDRLLDSLGLPERAGTGRLAAARAVARATGATVLLKGPDTLVVEPVGTAIVVPGGPPELATAGAGDVLAGVAGTVLAGGLRPAAAGVLAAHVHAVAAHRAAAGGPLRASAVAAAIPGVLASARAGAWDHG